MSLRTFFTSVGGTCASVVWPLTWSPMLPATAASEGHHVGA